MTDEQREFEQSLKQLQPVAAELNVAELMFRAGRDAARRDARRQLRHWQLSTLVTSVCALAAVSVMWSGLETAPANEARLATNGDSDPSEPANGLSIPDEPEIEKPPPVSQAVVETEEAAIKPQPLVDKRPPLFAWWHRQTTVSFSTDESYIDLRNRVLRDGVDALPKRDVGGGSNSEEPLTSSPLRLRDALDQGLWNQI